jgi:signal transduction histidine kinase/ActR/RegA family two-component response regulator
VSHWSPFEALDALNAEELRQRLLSMRALIMRAPIPIAIANDPECRSIVANRALASLLRMPLGSNISLTPADGAPPYRIQRNGVDIPSDQLPMQYAIAHRTSVSNDIEIVLGDGSVVYVQNEVEPLYDSHGQVYGCVSVCVDITDRKLAEISLRTAARRKDEFLATLSHELRNPLAPIRTALEVMRLAEHDPEMIERARSTMERQLLQLVRLTDDLLDVSRITENKLELRRGRLDLRSVMHSAIEATQPALDAHGHTLTIDMSPSPMWVDGDLTRLAQAFANLLNNAAKYTERGGHIRVSASVEGGVAVVTISDTGIGIPPDMLPRIFDMFTQLQNHRDRTLGGLGIGLALARRLVQLHGGTIDAQSDGPGRGSRFVVRLPLTRIADHADAATPIAASAPLVAGCRVLVADDNPDTAEMMRMMLDYKGHDVRVAGDGAEAVNIARAFAPKIAFLDIGMPRMDGYEAAQHIRSILGDRVVLVALTGWGQDDDKRRSHDAGFDHHLTKPPEPDRLDQLIAACGTAVERVHDG